MFYLLTFWTVLTLIQLPTSHKQKISITNLKKKSKKAKSMPFVVFRRDHLRFTSGIICGSGSFAVEFGDHFRSGDHLRSGIIAALYNSHEPTSDYLYYQLQENKISFSFSIFRFADACHSAVSAKCWEFHSSDVSQEVILLSYMIRCRNWVTWASA